MAKPVDSRATPEAALPFVGRRAELQNLTAALCDRHSRLIVGPPGCGKTRLVQEAVRAANQPFLLIREPPVLHTLLVSLAERLDCQPGRSVNMGRATSVALKPAVLDALRRAPRCVILEDVSDADPRMYRFLRELYYVPQTCLIVTAVSRGRLGFLRKLLWDPREEIALGPLRRADAQRLFELAADHFDLRSLDVDGFRRKVLAAARGNPGLILSMCRLAGRSEYRIGRYIKFLPLQMDVLSAHIR